MRELGEHFRAQRGHRRRRRSSAAGSARARPPPQPGERRAVTTVSSDPHRPGRASGHGRRRVAQSPRWVPATSPLAVWLAWPSSRRARPRSRATQPRDMGAVGRGGGGRRAPGGASPRTRTPLTHFFAATQRRLPGLALVGDAGLRRTTTAPVTVSEVVLLPGPDALVAPAWVPWHERVRPGDLGVGDLLPTPPTTRGWCPPTWPRTTRRSRRSRSRSASAAARVLAASRPRAAAERWQDGAARPGRRHGPRRPRRTAGPAVSSCRWPVRCAARSASAATSTRRPTARSSRSASAAARTPTCRRAGVAGRGGRAGLRRRGRPGAGRPLRTCPSRPTDPFGTADAARRRSWPPGRPRPPGSARTRTPRRTCASTATRTPGCVELAQNAADAARAAGVPGRLRSSGGVDGRSSCGSPTPAPRWTPPGWPRWPRCARRRSGTTPVRSAGSASGSPRCWRCRPRRGCVAVERRGGVLRRAHRAEAWRELPGPAAELARRDEPPVLRLVWPTGRRAAAGRTGSTPRSGCRCAPGVDGAALLGQARAGAPDLLLALPDLVEIDGGRRLRSGAAEPRPGEVVVIGDAALAAGPPRGTLAAADAADRPPSSAAGATGGLLGAAADRRRRPGPAGRRRAARPDRHRRAARAAGPADRPVPLEPDRRRVRDRPGRPTRCSRAAAAAYLDLVAAVDPPSSGWRSCRGPGSRARSSTAGCASCCSTPCAAAAWLPGAAGRRARAARRDGARPAGAGAARAARRRAPACSPDPASPVGLEATFLSPHARNVAFLTLRARRRCSPSWACTGWAPAELVERLLGVRAAAPAGGGRCTRRSSRPSTPCPGCATSCARCPSRSPTDAGARTRRRVLLPAGRPTPAGWRALALPGLHIADPDAVHPLLVRLGAGAAEPARCSNTRRCATAVDRSLDDADAGLDPAPLAEAVLGAGRPSWARGPRRRTAVGALALPDADGEPARADELMLPDAALRPLLAATPRSACSAPVAGAGPRAVLVAVGVLDGFAVVVDEDPAGPEHDLDDEDRWWDERPSRRGRCRRRARPRPGRRRRLARRAGPARRRAATPGRRRSLPAATPAGGWPGTPGSTATGRALAAAVGGRAGRPVRPGARSGVDEPFAGRDRGARRPRRRRRREAARPARPARRPGPPPRRRARRRRPRGAGRRRRRRAGSSPRTSTRRSGSARSTVRSSTSTTPWCWTRRGSRRGAARGARWSPAATRARSPSCWTCRRATEIVGTGEVAGAGRPVPWAAVPEVVRGLPARSASPCPPASCGATTSWGACCAGRSPGRRRVPDLARRRRPLARRGPGARPARGARHRAERAHGVVLRGTKSRGFWSTAAPRRRRTRPAGVRAVGAHLAAGAAGHGRRRRDERLRRADRDRGWPGAASRSRSSPGPRRRSSRRSWSWRRECSSATSPPARSRAWARTTCPASCARSPRGCCAPRPATSPAGTTSCTRTTGCPGRSAGWPATAGACRSCTARTPWPGSRTPRWPTGDPPEPMVRVIGEDQVVAEADRLIVQHRASRPASSSSSTAPTPPRIVTIPPGVDLDRFRPGRPDRRRGPGWGSPRTRWCSRSSGGSSR